MLGPSLEHPSWSGNATWATNVARYCATSRATARPGVRAGGARPYGSEELLWLATRGGAVALGLGERVGCVAPGFQGDFVAVDLPPGEHEGAALVDALLLRHDAGSVRAARVAGRLVRG